MLCCLTSTYSIDSFISIDERLLSGTKMDISYSGRLIMLQAAGSAEKEASEALTQPNVR